MSKEGKVNIECIEKILANTIEQNLWQDDFVTDDLSISVYDRNGDRLTASFSYNVVTRDAKPLTVEYVKSVLNSDDEVTFKDAERLYKIMGLKDEKAVYSLYNTLKLANEYYTE